MGFVYEGIGRITIEGRQESFRIHPSYGYDDTGNRHSDDLGSFGAQWRTNPHPEFLNADLDDLIEALLAYRAATTSKPMFVAGLFDEHEFMQQRPPHYGFVAHGPYFDLDAAVAKAQTLSTDPDEAVVLELAQETT